MGCEEVPWPEKPCIIYIAIVFKCHMLVPMGFESFNLEPSKAEQGSVQESLNVICAALANESEIKSGLHSTCPDHRDTRDTLSLTERIVFHKTTIVLIAFGLAGYIYIYTYTSRGISRGWE